MSTAIKSEEIKKTISQHEKESERILNKSLLYVSGISLLPSKTIAFPILAFVQYRMFDDLASVYDVQNDDSQNKLIVSSVLTTFMGWLASEGLDFLMETVPELRAVSGVISSAFINTFVTTVSWNVLNNHFKMGGTVDNMTVSNFIEEAKVQLNRENFQNSLSFSRNNDVKSLLFG